MRDQQLFKKPVGIAAALALAFLLGACSTAQNANTPQDSEVSVTEAAFDHYTVCFDKNTTPDDLTDDESFTYYTTGWGAVQKSSIVEIPYSEDAYISADDVPTPSRKGYYFAGWQTVPVVEESDIVNGISKYQVFFGTKLSEFGEAAGANSEGNAMYLKDFDTLTEDGTLTLYARWVEAKEVSTQEDLEAMADDLYGAYVLTNDIELTGEWEPVGTYFSNYENFSESWWTYAFRGTLDGAGHTISGLTVNGASREVPVSADTENAVWHDDGEKADGTAALFGAMAQATVTDLVIDGATIDATGGFAYDGKYCYAGVLAAFDMASTIKNVTVKNSVVKLQCADATAGEGEKLFLCVGGLTAGSWSSTISGCVVDATTIEVDASTVKSHGGELYVGGLIGESWATLKDSTVNAGIRVATSDDSEAAEDSTFTVNVGGVDAVNTSGSSNLANVQIDVAVSKPKGASSVNVGGFTGAQRYLSAESNDVTAAIATSCDLDPEEGVLNVGSVMGRLDAFYASLILIYADGVSCGSSNNTTNVTLNGDVLADVCAPTGVPSIDGEQLTYIATGDYTAADGTVYEGNLDEVLNEYGSYVTLDGLGDAKIMYFSIN